MGLLHTPSASLVFAPRYSYNAVASNSLDAYPAPFCLNWSRCINTSETGVTLQLNCPPIQPKRRFVLLSAKWHDKDDDNENQRDDDDDDDNNNDNNDNNNNNNNNPYFIYIFLFHYYYYYFFFFVLV